MVKLVAIDITIFAVMMTAFGITVGLALILRQPVFLMFAGLMLALMFLPIDGFVVDHHWVEGQTVTYVTNNGTVFNATSTGHWEDYSVDFEIWIKAMMVIIGGLTVLFGGWWYKEFS